MCGIFGLINKNQSYNSGKIFRTLCLFSESRGKEASGFAVRNIKEIKVFKTPFTASEMVRGEVFRNEILSLKNNDTSPFIAIGHSRLVTNGYEQYDNNNQPVVKNGFVVIHNGIIVNQADLWQKYGTYAKQSELDSELIPEILSQKINAGSDIGFAFKVLFEEIFGMTNTAVLSAFNKNLFLATNNGSIYFINDLKNGFFVFASERFILERLIKKHRLHSDKKQIEQLAPGYLVSIGFLSFSFLKLKFGESVLSVEISGTPCEIANIREDIKSRSIYINTSLEHKYQEPDSHFVDTYLDRKKRTEKLVRCTRCILPETFPFISFDEKGVCNYCRNYKKQGLRGMSELKKIANLHRRRDGKAECLVPLSGGRDSSFALHYVVNELGLRPIAYSYDWGMITDLARRNQSRMCGKLGVEHILVSADIRRKRENIRKNVTAWLKKPDLGTIPLFMAGDKQYFYYSKLLQKQNDFSLVIMGENPLEKTMFKSAFSGARQEMKGYMAYHISFLNKARLLGYYLRQYVKNPAFINSSLFDTAGAFLSYYSIKHDYLNLFNFIKWDEKAIQEVLINEYYWETDPGTNTTWRIGDGTAAFYNYIYYMLAGFTENDTFRSNQIREGDLIREIALQLSIIENQPRWDSMLWYCNTIGIEFEKTVRIINEIKPIYEAFR